MLIKADCKSVRATLRDELCRREMLETRLLLIDGLAIGWQLKVRYPPPPPPVYHAGNPTSSDATHDRAYRIRVKRDRERDIPLGGGTTDATYWLSD
ncbi:hypothetical protein EAI_14064 [Harpegnathos saltator]|uniref:Uncharacterized protein n=1 Tax=Harpegnathos saltator TaxID=610380 RepID=E2C7X5_HARSA|nr:hypothetical protein EAI_14064 [Harpegnathos saltator]